MGNVTNGSKVHFDKGKTTVFTKLNDVKNFDWGGGSVSMVDDTSLDDEFEKMKPGLINYGTISFDIGYVTTDAGYAALLDAYENKTLSSLKAEYADQETPVTGNNSTVTVDVYISQFKDPSGSKNTTGRTSVTMTIVSKPVRVAAV